MQGNRKHSFMIGWWHKSMGTEKEFLTTESKSESIDFAEIYNKYKKSTDTPLPKLAANAVTIEAVDVPLYIIPFLKTDKGKKEFLDGMGFLVFPERPHVDFDYEIDGFCIENEAGATYRWYAFPY